ncbi:Lrp/AsnC family transcriptional regulator [Leptolyngbya sp. AN02str]|uniref:Lrp/AsnC family transcriptional regulator n=1 Tax=Leptolyngbya sp. AN02str TaxID=3423363 RepID=UPI003D319B34
MSLDEIDSKIIVHLMQFGRATWSDLAALLGLSAPATADRVRRLEDKQIIHGYSARINPEAVGMHLTAFVAVTLERPEHRAPFLAWVQQQPAIQECHHTAGDDDYWLKVRCQQTRDLERLVSDELKGLPGVVRSRTTIVLFTVKETPVLPL